MRDWVFLLRLLTSPRSHHRKHRIFLLFLSLRLLRLLLRLDWHLNLRPYLIWKLWPELAEIWLRIGHKGRLLERLRVEHWCRHLWRLVEHLRIKGHKGGGLINKSGSRQDSISQLIYFLINLLGLGWHRHRSLFDTFWQRHEERIVYASSRHYCRLRLGFTCFERVCTDTARPFRSHLVWIICVINPSFYKGLFGFAVARNLVPIIFVICKLFGYWFDCLSFKGSCYWCLFFLLFVILFLSLRVKLRASDSLSASWSGYLV